MLLITAPDPPSQADRRQLDSALQMALSYCYPTGRYYLSSSIELMIL